MPKSDDFGYQPFRLLFNVNLRQWNGSAKDLWNHLKNHELKAHRAQTKEELYDLAEDKLTNMANDPELLYGLYFRCCVAELLR
jgi:hypothetical protein